MYIFLDESYNLKDRAKPQFISINGFQTTAVKQVWKRWKIYRRRFITKSRIHATDRRFEPLRNKSLNLIQQPGTVLLTVFQVIQEIPVGRSSFYYKKGKLNFEKVYEDMLKALFDKLNLQEYRKVIITIDERKHKGGILAKKQFQKNILYYLERSYGSTVFSFNMQQSSSNILLEVADFISNTFYKRYIGQKIDALEKLRIKTIEIKNPLGNPRE
ncbi:MAG: DUF3800 domain-containing protein [Candidatus Omnitrophica bacterium]|nr:DUF3800 domain-containing protein [Candidatus Omnitrophota bacterium]MBU4512148.1 DUF3800 domain-containing protein [Patescibacteria group bacterium]MCG2693224.1 DUF3800 domain-containing protein [Candidatus Parcubacteria bacterium]